MDGNLLLPALAEFLFFHFSLMADHAKADIRDSGSRVRAGWATPVHVGVVGEEGPKSRLFVFVVVGTFS